MGLGITFLISSDGNDMFLRKYNIPAVSEKLCPVRVSTIIGEDRRHVRRRNPMHDENTRWRERSNFAPGTRETRPGHRWESSSKINLPMTLLSCVVRYALEMSMFVYNPAFPVCRKWSGFVLPVLL